MKWTSIVADASFFSPAPLLIAGWVKWVRATEPRGWRRNVIAVGLGSASISCLCLYGVVLYLKKSSHWLLERVHAGLRMGCVQLAGVRPSADFGIGWQGGLARVPCVRGGRAGVVVDRVFRSLSD